MNKEKIEKFQRLQETAADFPLPCQMRENWIVIKCLKEGKDSWTVLVQENVSKITCVLKWGTNLQADLLRQECQMLQKLKNMELIKIPEGYQLFEENNGVYFLREYIKGIPLDRYVMKKGGLKEPELLETAVKICKTVEIFHGQKEPLIHRDIKPENIVLTPSGEVVLIDFGTMRFYKETGQRDTFVVGSRETAAPEQYGYTQTDRRTDVHAIGQTLLYMAAECYAIDQLAECSISSRLKKVIKKACSFEPDARYKDAAELRIALEKCDNKRSKMFAGKIGAAAGLIAAGYLLAIVFQSAALLKLGANGGNTQLENTDTPSESTNIDTNTETDTETNTTNNENNNSVENKETPSDNPAQNAPVSTQTTPQNTADSTTASTSPVVFTEPLIEQAVHKELSISEDVPITTAMLDSVTTLRIVGTDLMEKEDTFWGIGHHVDNKADDFGSTRGSIADLTDLSQMKKLEVLSLCNEKIDDISPLAGLPLRELYLSDNMISDFSILSEFTDLEILCIRGNLARDLSALSSCSSLEQLNIAQMQLNDVDFLADMNVKYLDMSGSQIKSENLMPVAQMPKLEDLYLGDVNEPEIQALSQMNHLKNLTLWGADTILENLEPLKGMENLESLAFMTNISSLEGIEDFPVLKWLVIDNSNLIDLSPLVQAKHLRYLTVNNTSIEDFSPLFQCKELLEVCCNEEVKEKILQQNPAPDFEFG